MFDNSASRIRDLQNDIGALEDAGDINRILRKLCSACAMNSAQLYERQADDLAGQKYLPVGRYAPSNGAQAPALGEILNADGPPKVPGVYSGSAGPGKKPFDPLGHHVVHSGLGEEDFCAVFPTHCDCGRRFVLVLVGETARFSYGDFLEINMLVSLLTDRLCEIDSDTGVNPFRLTVREVEVLEWIANGKTSADIAIILDLSEHTINAYIKSSMQKLATVNRPQTVAKALRHNIIQ